MFKTVFIMLGEACNFQCKYCLQHPILTEQLSSDINPDLIKYLKELSKKSKIHIMFYGGEPLLYFKNIKEIHAQLKEDNCSFGIISNCSLLNREMVDYIIENKISLAASQDGRNTTSFRTENVLDNEQILEWLHEINAGVSAVVHAQNMDIIDIYNYWWEKGFSVERTNIDLIMDTGLQNPDLTAFDFEKWSNLMKNFEEKVYETLTTNKANIEMFLGNKFYNRIYHVVKNLKAEDVDEFCSNKCGVGIKTINVDLQGNCYLCHNSSQQIGTIYDSYEKLVENFKPYDQYSHSQQCKECPAFILCGGGCLLVPQEPRDRYYCEMNKIFYGSFINAILRSSRFEKEEIKNKASL